MKHSLIYLTTLSLLCLSRAVLADSSSGYYVTGAPKGFEDFITFTEGDISVQLPGASPVDISAKYRFGEVKIIKDESITSFESYLTQNSVQSDVIAYILKQLTQGVINSAGCKGDTSVCTITQADIDFVFDYDSRKLRIFLNPAYFSSRPVAIQYAKSKNDHLGVINNFNAFSSLWDEQGLSLTVADDMLVSLPFGHLRSDLTYHGDGAGSSMDINELSYNMDVRNHSLGGGRFRYGKPINSVAFMDYEAYQDVEALYVGSSTNLALNGGRQYQSLGFYSSEPASLKILRDGKSILQRNVTEGQGSISYSDLPTGIYDVEVITEAGGRQLSREHKTIVNVSRFSLGKGEVDYYLQGGKYIHSEFSLNEDESLDGKAFIKGAMTYRPVEPVMLGSEILVASSDYSLKFGVLGYVNNETNVQLVNSYFNNRSNYLRLLINYNTATLDYSDYSYYPNTVERTPDLTGYLLGDVSYRNLSLSQSFTLGHGAGYFSLYYRDENNYSSPSNNIKYTGTTLGYSVPFWWESSLNLSFNYSLSDNNQDNWQTGINWSIPIGDSVNIRSSLLLNKNDATMRTGAEKRWNANPETKAMLSTGVQYDNQDMTYDATGTLDANRKWGNTSLYSFVDSKGSRGITSTLSSTQIIKNEQVFYTDRPSESYILAQSNLDNDAVYGIMKVEKDKATRYNYAMNTGETLIPVDGYASLKGLVDINESEYQSSGNTDFSYFSYPGSIYSLVNDLYRTNYALVYLPDTSIDELMCTNDVCLDFDEIRDDIFKITVKAEQPFALLKNGKTCSQFDSGLKNNKNIGKLLCS